MTHHLQPQQAEFAACLPVESNLARPGTQLFDSLMLELQAENPVGFSIGRGLLAYNELTVHGDGVEGIARFVPGVDPAHNLDIPRTLASQEGFFARRSVSGAQLPRLQVLADVPERLKYTTGRATLFDTARYATAMLFAVADNAKSPIEVVQTTEDRHARTYSGNSSDVYTALQVLDRGIQTNVGYTASGGFTEGLEDVYSGVNERDDVVVVVSDLLSGYEKGSNEFSWVNVLKALQVSLGDRLYVLRLKSRAQTVMPFNPKNKKNLPISRLQEVRDVGLQAVEARNHRLDEVLDRAGIRLGVVDAHSPDKTVMRQVADFILAEA